MKDFFIITLVLQPIGVFSVLLYYYPGIFIALFLSVLLFGIGLALIQEENTKNKRKQE